MVNNNTPLPIKTISLKVIFTYNLAGKKITHAIQGDYIVYGKKAMN